MTSLNRSRSIAVLACVALAGSARPALAQQTLNVSFGHFMMPGHGRVESDVLLIEHHDLLFDIRDFSGASLGGEWLWPVRDRFEAGVGVSFARRTVSAVHGRARNSDGSLVPRTLGLRQLPVAATFRMLPLGQAYRVQPYAGGGLAFIHWSFSESGDFASQTGPIFRGEAYEATGLAVGPVLLVGLRVAGDTLAFGVEGRHQRARGSFGPAFARVQDPDIDLDGWTLQFTAGMRLAR